MRKKNGYNIIYCIIQYNEMFRLCKFMKIDSILVFVQDWQFVFYFCFKGLYLNRQEDFRVYVNIFYCYEYYIIINLLKIIEMCNCYREFYIL